MTRIWGQSRMICRVASMPSIWGITTSMSTTSGSSCLASRIGRAAVRGLANHFDSRLIPQCLGQASSHSRVIIHNQDTHSNHSLFSCDTLLCKISYDFAAHSSSLESRVGCPSVVLVHSANPLVDPLRNFPNLVSPEQPGDAVHCGTSPLSVYSVSFPAYHVPSAAGHRDLESSIANGKGSSLWEPSIRVYRGFCLQQF